MRTPSTRVGRAAALLASPAAILLAGALIWNASDAAFSATTRNSGNDWSTGTVAISDDDAGSARFQVTNMLPGQTETKCITVTANASVPGVVKAYSLNAVSSNPALADHILITATHGTGGSFGSCNGYVPQATEVTNQSLATLSLVNSYANGLGAWSVGGNGAETRTYQFTWTFDTTGLTQDQLNQLQGAHTGIDIQWELQNS